MRGEARCRLGWQWDTAHIDSRAPTTENRNQRSPLTVRNPAMSSVTQTYGANTAFIEDLYELYRANPDSVSASWREFFHDYEPRFEEEFEEEAAQPPTPPQPVLIAPVAVPVAPVPQPSNPATQQPKTPSNQPSVPLRGAASKIAQNMEMSLTIPTA